MVLYAVLLLSLLSRADTPLSLSLSQFSVCVSRSLISRLFIRLFFLWVPLSRFRQYYEELSWNKAPRHQMFILFCSVCHTVSLSLLLLLSHGNPCCKFCLPHVFYVFFISLSSIFFHSHTSLSFHHNASFSLLACFNLLLLCLLSIRKPHSYLIEGPRPRSQQLN